MRRENAVPSKTVARNDNARAEEKFENPARSPRLARVHSTHGPLLPSCFPLFPIHFLRAAVLPLFSPGCFHSALLRVESLARGVSSHPVSSRLVSSRLIPFHPGASQVSRFSLLPALGRTRQTRFSLPRFLFLLNFTRLPGRLSATPNLRDHLHDLSFYRINPVGSF